MTATLLLGGARSGKSARALALAASAAEKVFVATAEPLDEEMAARIARHRRDRSPDFTTIEAPLDLTGALRSAFGPGRAVVVDCLTLWLSNLMRHGRPVEQEMAALCEAIRAVAGDPEAKLILVSNEVGAGIAPANALAREFRDAHGRLNQLVAATADRVELVTAGLPLVLKPPGGSRALE